MSAELKQIPLVPAARAARQRLRATSELTSVFSLLDEVKDPEIPVLTIWELGVLQDVLAQPDGSLIVIITPTYSGCPAMQAIESDIRRVLAGAGYVDVEIQQRLQPVWTTDWMEPAAQARLVAYGIAGPERLACPQCASHDVELISEFASTACKSLWRCRSCLEPFDQFKRL